MNKKLISVVLAGALVAAGCGSDSDSSGGASSSGGGSGKTITLAVNPWTGSKVNAEVAKAVMESSLGVKVTLTEIDENATWVGMDKGDIDAVLEVWPSGHAADYKTYIDEKKTIVDIGKLGPTAKIGWYVPKFALDENPSLKTWEGLKDAVLAKKFATAASGDQGQFLMGDPSYVSYDEQIITNLKLPLKYTVAGSEAALLTAIDQAVKDKKPLLLQFWQPHWKHSKVELSEIKLPDVTDACTASAASDPQDGKYACDYPPDALYKAAEREAEGQGREGVCVPVEVPADDRPAERDRSAGRR